MHSDQNNIILVVYNFFFTYIIEEINFLKILFHCAVFKLCYMSDLKISKHKKNCQVTYLINFFDKYIICNRTSMILIILKF